MAGKRLTIEDKQAFVEGYISDYWFGKFPLKFGTETGCDNLTKLQVLDLSAGKQDRESNIDEAVRLVLRLAESYSSVRASDDYMETTRYRFRSAMDIWRHIIFYHKDVTIWDVMEAIYRIRGELCGQFCNVVMRRVFKIYPAGITRGRNLYDRCAKDEFRLTFRSWSRMQRSERKKSKKKPLAVLADVSAESPQ